MGSPRFLTFIVRPKNMVNTRICCDHILIGIVLSELINALPVTCSRSRGIRQWKYWRRVHSSNERYRWVQRFSKEDIRVGTLEATYKLPSSLFFPHSLWILWLPHNVALISFLLHVYDHLLVQIQDRTHDPLQIHPLWFWKKEVLIRK